MQVGPINLTEPQRRLLALALLGLGDRQRETKGLAEQVVELADKLGVLPLLHEYGRDWLRHAKGEQADG